MTIYHRPELHRTMEVGVADKESSSVRNNSKREDSEELNSVSFLDSPEVVWSEPQVEQVLTYMGNGL